MTKTISITVDVEEWFHSEWFNVQNVINKYYDGTYPDTDVVDCINHLIEIFNRHDIRATFFVLGETVKRYPNIINLIEKNNHEIACHRYYHNKKYKDISEFRNDIKKFKNEIFKNVIGFRSPNFFISENEFKILIDENFIYDSSIVPSLRIPGWYGNPNLSITPYAYNVNYNRILEFPIAVYPFLRLPGGGGWYLRNIGLWWTKNIIKSILKKNNCVIIYIHPWEISNLNPNHKEIPFHVFRNTGDIMIKRIIKLINLFKDKKFVEIKYLLKEYTI